MSSGGGGQPLFGRVRWEGRGLSAEVRGRGHAWLRGKPFPKVRGSLGTQKSCSLRCNPPERLKKGLEEADGVGSSHFESPVVGTRELLRSLNHPVISTRVGKVVFAVKRKIVGL